MSDGAPPPDDDQDPDACPNCLNLIGPRTHWKDDGFVGYTCNLAPSIRGRVVAAVEAERNRQDGLWGPVEGLTHSQDRWYALVAEEIGEAAKALNEGDTPQMMVELVQAAATIYSWLESVEHASQGAHDFGNQGRMGALPASDPRSRER